MNKAFIRKRVTKDNLYPIFTKDFLLKIFAKAKTAKVEIAKAKIAQKIKILKLKEHKILIAKDKITKAIITKAIRLTKDYLIYLVAAGMFIFYRLLNY